MEFFLMDSEGQIVDGPYLTHDDAEDARRKYYPTVQPGLTVIAEDKK